MSHDELVKAVARYMNAEEENAKLRAELQALEDKGKTWVCPEDYQAAQALNEQYLGQIREQAKTIEKQSAEVERCKEIAERDGKDYFEQRKELKAKELQIGAMREVIDAAKRLDRNYVKWELMGLAGVEMLDALIKLHAAEASLQTGLRGEPVASVAEKPVDEKQKYCDHGWDRTGDDAVCKYCKIAARDVLKPLRDDLPVCGTCQGIGKLCDYHAPKVDESQKCVKPRTTRGENLLDGIVGDQDKR